MNRWYEFPPGVVVREQYLRLIVTLRKKKIGRLYEGVDLGLRHVGRSSMVLRG